MSPSHYRSFVKDNSVVIAGHVMVYMKGIILMPVIIKTVGATVYGGFVLLTSILGIAFGISSFGAGFRAKRFLPSAATMIARAELYYPQFYFQFFSICVLSIILFLLASEINIHFFKGEISYSALVIPAYLISYFFYAQCTDYFRYTSRVHYMTLATLLFPYLYIGLILIFFYWYRFLSINLLMISHVISALLVAAPCVWLICSETGVRLSFYDVQGLVSDIKLGFPLVLGFIVDFVLAASDRYLIAFYMTVTDVGYYTPGYVLGSLIIFIPKAMGTALPQLLSRAVDNREEHEAQRMLDYALKIFLLMAIPFILGSMTLGRAILTLLANEEVAEHAYWVAPIVAAGTLFYGLNIILSNVLFVRLRTYAVFKINLFAATFNLLANTILLYFFKNITVAAITTFGSYLLTYMYTCKVVRQQTWFFDLHWLVILKSLTASLLMGAVLIVASTINGGRPSAAMLAGQVVLGFFCYLSALLAMGTFTKKELQFVKAYFVR
jgi:O-antigen/teichoic acid export membrane protein